MAFLDNWVFRFGPAEYFFAALLALLCIGLSTSTSLPKITAALSMGGLLALIGVDPASGTARWTFGFEGLEEGLDASMVLIAFVMLPRVVAHPVSREAPTSPAPGFACPPRAVLTLGWRTALMVLAGLLFPVDWLLLPPESAIRVAAATLLCALGLACHRTAVPGVAVFCSFLLGPMLEENFRRMLMLSGGSFPGVLQRPLVGCFIVVAVLAIAAQVTVLRRRAMRLATELDSAPAAAGNGR